MFEELLKSERFLKRWWGLDLRACNSVYSSAWCGRTIKSATDIMDPADGACRAIGIIKRRWTREKPKRKESPFYFIVRMCHCFHIKGINGCQIGVVKKEEKTQRFKCILSAKCPYWV